MQELNEEIIEIIVDDFASITLDNIRDLLRLFNSKGLSEDEIWHAIAVSIVLDMAFGRSHKLINVLH